jgi:hypothetical protein
MTNRELVEKLYELDPDAVIVKAENSEFMDKEVVEAEYYDNAVYLDAEGNTQRGKIIVI